MAHLLVSCLAVAFKHTWFCFPPLPKRNKPRYHVEGDKCKAMDRLLGVKWRQTRIGRVQRQGEPNHGQTRAQQKLGSSNPFYIPLEQMTLRHVRIYIYMNMIAPPNLPFQMTMGISRSSTKISVCSSIFAFYLMPELFI